MKKILEEILNEAPGTYPSLDSFRDKVGGPAYHIDNVLGMIKNLQDIFTKELRNDLSTVLTLTENAVKLEKNEADKKKVKEILYKYQYDSSKFKKAKLDSMASSISKAISGMATLEEACNIAKKLYSEIK